MKVDEFWCTGGTLSRARAIDSCVENRKGTKLEHETAILISCLDAPDLIPIDRLPSHPTIRLSVKRGDPFPK